MRLHEQRSLHRQARHRPQDTHTQRDLPLQEASEKWQKQHAVQTGDGLTTASNSVIEYRHTLGRVKGKPRVYLHKHQKKILIACAYDNCFHPATSSAVVGTKTLWFCGCHDPLNPEICHATLAEKSNLNHTMYGDCVFCKTTHSRNIMQGITGDISFICERCYRTPLAELRRYWKPQ